jgi:hypothetical protein
MGCLDDEINIFHIHLFNIAKYESQNYAFRFCSFLDILFKAIYSTSTSHLHDKLMIDCVAVIINCMSTTPRVNGKMDSKGTPPAGDLLNV